jgi:hypothetical protein
MGNIANFISFTDPDDIAEIVGDDAQVITMVTDVGRKKGAIAPTQYYLLAAIGCLPIHFHVELVGFDQSRSFTEPLSNLSQEEDEPMSPGAIAGETRVRLYSESPTHRTAHQGKCLGRVPGLRGQR